MSRHLTSPVHRAVISEDHETMQAIIRAGGKQAKVSEGDVIDVERIRDAEGSVSFTPLLIINDDGTVISDKDALGKATVTADVIAEHRGDKIDIFKYKNKTGYRRRMGHRQTYTRIQVTKIDAGAKKRSSKKKAEPADDTADAAAEEA